MVVVLGIESTAHTIGFSIVKNDDVLSNEKKLFHTDSGGMIPAQVADHHINNFEGVLEKAILKAEIKLNEIDYIAYSASPGIGHSLRIGCFIAKTLAIKLNKPLIPVNHCIAHLEIGRLESGFNDPILLYASGANTQVIGFESARYRVFGETLDVGIGNFLDSLARELGLGFPGGPKLEELAKKGSKLLDIPYVVKGMDISLGGILTFIKNKYIGKESKEDIAFSVQETVFAMLVEVSERALAHTGKKELVIGGGVGCNSRLQGMLSQMCRDRGCKFSSPGKEYLVDNAAMIAYTGFLNKDIVVDIGDAFIDPYMRTDEVNIGYR